MTQPTTPSDLLNLLLRLQDIESQENEQIKQRANPLAAKRLLALSGKTMSPKQCAFLKSIQEGKQTISGLYPNGDSVYRTDFSLWKDYGHQHSSIVKEHASPLVRDTDTREGGKLRTRLTPLNLALEMLTINGIGIPENEMREYLSNFTELRPPKPNKAFCEKLANLHREGVTDAILHELQREHPQLFNEKYGLTLDSGTEATLIESQIESDIPPKQRLSAKLSNGMSWEDAKEKAERHVKCNNYPGVNSLAKIVGCAPSTMSKAIKRSPYLKARKAEHEAERKGVPRETQMNDVVLDKTRQTTEADPLELLIAEHEADDDDPTPLSSYSPRSIRRRSR